MSENRSSPRAMQSTMVYLTQEQRSGLARRAKQRHSKVAAEIRSAIDAYLAGVTPQEIEMLDLATRKAQEEIEAMLRTANEIVEDHGRFARKMAQLRREVRK